MICAALIYGRFYFSFWQVLHNANRPIVMLCGLDINLSLLHSGLDNICRRRPSDLQVQRWIWPTWPWGRLWRLANWSATYWTTIRRPMTLNTDSPDTRYSRMIKVLVTGLVTGVVMVVVMGVVMVVVMV